MESQAPLGIMPLANATPFGKAGKVWNGVFGTGSFTGQITSTLASGTQPFAITSVTPVDVLRVKNLGTQYNIDPTTKTLVDGTPVDLFSVTVANNTAHILRIVYNETAINTATNDIQNHVGEVLVSLVAGNTGVVTTSINNHTELTAASVGTLTDSWTATAAAGPVSPVTIAVSANTSMAATTSFSIRYAIYSMTNPQITYL
jgi:hypothetical protein